MIGLLWAWHFSLYTTENYVTWEQVANGTSNNAVRLAFYLNLA